MKKRYIYYNPQTDQLLEFPFEKLNFFITGYVGKKWHLIEVVLIQLGEL